MRMTVVEPVIDFLTLTRVAISQDEIPIPLSSAVIVFIQVLSIFLQHTANFTLPVFHVYTGCVASNRG